MQQRYIVTASTPEGNLENNKENYPWIHDPTNMIMITTTTTAAEADNSALAEVSAVADDADEVLASALMPRWAAAHVADEATCAPPHCCCCSSGRCTATR